MPQKQFGATLANVPARLQPQFTQHRHTKDSVNLGWGRKMVRYTNRSFRYIFAYISRTHIQPPDASCSLHPCAVEAASLGGWMSGGRQGGSGMRDEMD